nr:MAG TPA: hypothetical protein [Caudoviricetes sp.]
MDINQLLDFSWFNWKLLLQQYIGLSIGLSIFNHALLQREVRIFHHHVKDIADKKNPSDVKKRFVDGLMPTMLYAIVIAAVVHIFYLATLVYLGLDATGSDADTTKGIHSVIAIAIILAMSHVSSKFHRVGLSKGFDLLDIYLFIPVKMIFLFILSMLFPRWLSLSVKADMAMDNLKSYHYVRKLNIFYVIFIELIYGAITANIMPMSVSYERIFETEMSNRAYCFLKYSIYDSDTLGRHSDPRGRIMAEINLLEADRADDVVMDRITRRYMNADNLESAREIRDRLLELQEKRNQEYQD